MRHRGIFLLVGFVAAGLCAGCEKRGAAERFGKTFYLDGAGNWGFGASDVPEGLRQAGYHGDVEVFMWTISFNPLVDQLVTGNARLRSAILANKIKEYARRHPDREINVIALSAGTGVAVWAVEQLDGKARVNNLILLGSSLSSTYDMRKALRHIDGNVVAYYSPHDNVLDAVRVVGTIDGKRGVDSIGQVGLHPPGGPFPQIVNIGWSRKYLPLGWAGAHTDCTNQLFVRRELSRHLIKQAEEAPTQRASGIPPADGPLAAAR
jgi:pimeloyl-ACP methyl ester carboxylesterase